MTILIMVPVHAAELVAPMVQLTLQFFI